MMNTYIVKCRGGLYYSIDAESYQITGYGLHFYIEDTEVACFSLEEFLHVMKAHELKSGPIKGGVIRCQHELNAKRTVTHTMVEITDSKDKTPFPFDIPLTKDKVVKSQHKHDALDIDSGVVYE